MQDETFRQTLETLARAERKLKLWEAGQPTAREQVDRFDGRLAALTLPGVVAVNVPGEHTGVLLLKALPRNLTIDLPAATLALHLSEGVTLRRDWSPAHYSIAARLLPELASAIESAADALVEGAPDAL